MKCLKRSIDSFVAVLIGQKSLVSCRLSKSEKIHVESDKLGSMRALETLFGLNFAKFDT